VRIDVTAIELGEIVVIQLKQPSDDGPVVVERLDHLYVHLLIMPRSIRTGAAHASAAATSGPPTSPCMPGDRPPVPLRHPAHAPRIPHPSRPQPPTGGCRTRGCSDHRARGESDRGANAHPDSGVKDSSPSGQVRAAFDQARTGTANVSCLSPNTGESVLTGTSPGTG
jgi:hypothetical protein